MDLSTVAAWFDDLEVYDGYTNQLLFSGALDYYDGTVRDSSAGWRRSVSAQNVTLPARGVVKVNGEYFIAGRVVTDSFGPEGPMRKHLLLHPADGLYAFGSADAFIRGTPVQAYGALSWLKDAREEEVSSNIHAIYNLYVSEMETLHETDFLCRNISSGAMFRIQGSARMPSGTVAYYVTALEPAVLQDVQYRAFTGGYDAATGLRPFAAAATVKALVERYQTNYHYQTNAAERFERADKVVTVSQQHIADPKAGELVTVGSTIYRILDKQSDGLGSWELHVRI